MIRKVDWMQILRESPVIGDYVKKNVDKDYKQNIKEKVLAQKNKDLERITKRFDYQQIQTILSKDIVQEMLGKAEKNKENGDKQIDLLREIEECPDDQEKFGKSLEYVETSVENLTGYINELEEENEDLAEEVQYVFEEIERYKIQFE